METYPETNTHAVWAMQIGKVKENSLILGR